MSTCLPECNQHAHQACTHAAHTLMYSCTVHASHSMHACMRTLRMKCSTPPRCLCTYTHANRTTPMCIAHTMYRMHTHLAYEMLHPAQVWVRPPGQVAAHGRQLLAVDAHHQLDRTLPAWSVDIAVQFMQYGYAVHLCGTRLQYVCACDWLAAHGGFRWLWPC